MLVDYLILRGIQIYYVEIIEFFMLAGAIGLLFGIIVMLIKDVNVR